MPRKMIQGTGGSSHDKPDPRTPLDPVFNKPEIGGLVMLTEDGKQNPLLDELNLHTCRVADWVEGELVVLVMFVNPWKTTSEYIVQLKDVYHPVAIPAISVEDETNKALKATRLCGSTVTL
jgi:hypothetical protein